MGDLNKGLTFTDGKPNDLTAARLHELVEGATLTNQAITGKEELTSLSSNDYFLAYNTTANELRKVPYSSLSSSPVGVSAFRNLVIKNNSGSPTTTADITADEMTLRDSNGVLIRAATVSESVNITVSGANGLDTGAEASLTWYYIWVISNGTDVSALLSTSATSPTMPSGYDYRARVGGVFNDGSSNFWTFQQNDDDYSTTRQAHTLTNAYTANADPTAALDYQTITLAGSGTPYVPPNAIRVRGNLGRTSAANCIMYISGTNQGLGAVAVIGGNLGTTIDSFTYAGFFDVPLVTAQTVYIKSAITVGSSTSRLSVSGFKIKP